jgi:4-amino-4-deoxy-L-arabinose transferase-like glycosyltransferase
MMIDYKKILLLAAIFVISGLYCVFFFNGFLGLADGNDYAGLGRSIIRGDGFQLGHLYPLAFSFDENIPQPNNMWAPAYPVYLAVWFLIFGLSDSTILAATIFSVWLLVLAVYIVARKIVGENWALLAAALMGLNQSMLATALEGSPEPLTAALLLFSVYMLISKKNRITLLVSGVVFGLTVLTRYQTIVLALPVLIFLTDRKPKPVILWLAMMIMTISPWLIRNYLVFGNPVFTMQSYGEFTKGMGHLDYYYYTYRSFTPMSLSYALANFPFYVLKKYIAGNLFFSWWAAVVLNFFGAVAFIFALMRIRYFDGIRRRFIGFAVASLLLLIALSSLNGIHLRHLVNIQGILIVALVLGYIHFREHVKLFRNRYIHVAALILLLLPLRFPFLEIELKNNADRIEINKKAYELIKEYTADDAVIVSDASDAVWWYCDRSSIWIPVVYGDLKILLETHQVDYIYFEKISDYTDRLEDRDLIDFLSTTSIVDGSPFGWSLYKIN